MHDPAGGSAISLALLAIVDGLALLGGFFFVWRALQRWWRFLGRARRDSVRGAIRYSRQTSHRQAYRCATDVNYYLSRLSLLFCANLTGVGGLLFAALCLTDAPAHLSPRWHGFASASMLLFAVFSTRSICRSVYLARHVMQIRRNLRSAARRRQRDLLGGPLARIGRSDRPPAAAA